MPVRRSAVVMNDLPSTYGDGAATWLTIRRSIMPGTTESSDARENLLEQAVGQGICGDSTTVLAGRRHSRPDAYSSRWPSAAKDLQRWRSACISSGPIGLKPRAIVKFWRSTPSESVPLIVVATGRLIA